MLYAVLLIRIRMDPHWFLDIRIQNRIGNEP
jgi:hypothetical protein